MQQYAPQSEGGQFRTNVPNCEPDLRMSTVYGPAPYGVVTRVDETTIISAIVLARRPAAGTDAEVSEDTLTMFGGSLAVDEGFCPVDVEPSEASDVFLLQGRTTVSGTELLYENATGLAHLAGPVLLEREPGDAESPLIRASSEELVYSVDTGLSTLTGNVQISSGERFSQADELVLDEEAGLATLYGNPAISREGDDEVSGSELLYYLDTDDVVVSGGVRGTIELP